MPYIRGLEERELDLTGARGVRGRNELVGQVTDSKKMLPSRARSRLDGVCDSVESGYGPETAVERARQDRQECCFAEFHASPSFR